MPRRPGVSPLPPAPGRGDRAAAPPRRHRWQPTRGRAPGEARGAPVDRLAMATWLALLAVVLVALLAAGTSWNVVRREKTRVGFLLATTQALLEARDLDAASVELLRRASVRFNADCAELTLLPEAGTSAAFRTTVRAGEPVEVMRSTDLQDEDGAFKPPIFGVVHLAAAASDPWVTRLCGRLAISRGLAVTLRHGSRSVGYLALGMRASDSPESRSDDEQLQE